MSVLTSVKPEACVEVLASDSASCRNKLSASLAVSQLVSRRIRVALFNRAGTTGCSSVAVPTELCACGQTMMGKPFTTGVGGNPS